MIGHKIHFLFVAIPSNQYALIHKALNYAERVGIEITYQFETIQPKNPGLVDGAGKPSIVPVRMIQGSCTAEYFKEKTGMDYTPENSVQCAEKFGEIIIRGDDGRDT